jgi:hypothetical protein
MNLSLFIVFFLALGSMGTTCLFFPEAVRRLTQWLLRSGRLSEMLAPFIASDAYLATVRSAGLLALLMSTLLAVAAIMVK